MAREKRDNANKPEEQAERKGQAVRPEHRQPSQAKDSAKDTATQPQAPVSNTGQPGAPDQREPESGPQPSSLSNALYLWLSKRPASVQNTILLGFAVCLLLFFSARVVEGWNILWGLVPKKVPKIYGVIRNKSDLDVDLSKTGVFTIQTSPPLEGKFDLYPVQVVAATNSKVITVPRKGGQVDVYAKVRNARKVYPYYRGGEYPLTLTLVAGTQHYTAQIDRFSEAGLKKKWTLEIPKDVTAKRVIKVCFDELRDSSKSSFLQDETDLEGLIFLEKETDQFKDKLWDEVERGDFFRVISKEYFDEISDEFDEISDGKEPDPQSPVYAKIAIGIYETETEKDKKMIRLEVTDAKGKIKKGDATTRDTYDPERQEETVSNFITFATCAIIREYPIKSRISDVSRDRYDKDKIVEMRIGRLAGVRNHMKLGVYCGEANIGHVEITATWPGSCEGMLHLNGTYATETFTSLVVCSSTLEEWK